MLAIVQARFSSVRMPGKVLRSLLGRPLLHWVIDSVRHAHKVKRVVVATSTDTSDDGIEALCGSLGVTCYRGSLTDVASRFLLALEREKAPAFLRVSGDSPALDPSLIDTGINLYATENWDLVTNVFPRTFPKGQSIEVINASTFRTISKLFTNPSEREHVTKYFYENSDTFRIVSFTSGRNLGGVQLSVDTEEDFKAIEHRLLTREPGSQSWETLVVRVSN